jgi:hypothetical protein
VAAGAEADDPAPGGKQLLPPLEGHRLSRRRHEYRHGPERRGALAGTRQPPVVLLGLAGAGGGSRHPGGCDRSLREPLLGASDAVAHPVEDEVHAGGSFGHSAVRR